MCGYVVVTFIDRQEQLGFFEVLALCWPIGLGAITILLFFVFLLKLPAAYLIVSLLVAGAFVCRILVFDIKRFKRFQMPKFSVKILPALLLIGLLVKFAYVFIEACSKPEYSWDACGNWTAVGKYLFYLSKDSTARALELLKVYQSNYPRFNSIAHFWFFSWLGQANDQWSKIYFPILLVSFTTLFYINLRKIRSQLGSLFFAYVLLSCPLFLYHVTIGYADFSIAVYFSLAMIYFFNWVKDSKNAHFWLFSIFISLTTWVKLEGKPLFLLGLLILFVYLALNKTVLKEKAIRLLQYLGVFFVVGLPWQIFALVNHLPSREGLIFNLDKFWPLHLQIYEKLFVDGSWGILWYAIVALFFIYCKNIFGKKGAFYLALSILLFYGIILFVYLFTADGYGWFNVSFNRLWLSIYPVALFLIAAIMPSFHIAKKVEL